MNEVDGLYNCGSITGQSNSPGYPWEHEGRGFCESVSRLVEGASEEEVQKIREIAEVVFFGASCHREEIRPSARLSRFSYPRPIPRITPRTLEEWEELGSLCMSVLQVARRVTAHWLTRRMKQPQGWHHKK